MDDFPLLATLRRQQHALRMNHHSFLIVTRERHPHLTFSAPSTVILAFHRRPCCSAVGRCGSVVQDSEGYQRLGGPGDIASESTSLLVSNAKSPAGNPPRAQSHDVNKNGERRPQSVPRNARKASP
jgi:hypothetical protein